MIRLLKININTYQDLIDFISRPDISDKNAVAVTNKFLNIYCSEDIGDRNEFIKKVKGFIEKYGHTNEKPFFL